MGLSDELAIGFVGRLVPVKQPDVFAALVRALPDVVGVALGQGPLAHEIAGVPRLRHLGAVERPQDYLAGLDALVLTSRREGCPLVAIEAMAAGVPVVGLDVPGVHDALADWGAGVLVPVAEGVRGLAAAVEGLRDDPDHWLAVLLENPYMNRLAGAEVILDRAGVTEALAVLDVGCGTGRVALPAVRGWTVQRNATVAVDRDRFYHRPALVTPGRVP